MHHKKGAIEGDLESGFLNSGQIAGLLEDLPSVEDLFNRMMNEAEQKLQNDLIEFRQLKKES